MRAELAKVDILVVPTSAYNYTVQEIQASGMNAPGCWVHHRHVNGTTAPPVEQHSNSNRLNVRSAVTMPHAK